MSIVGTRPPTLDEWNKYELQSYDKLKRVFVIFICPYDPFGDMIYFIRKENMPCSENGICVSCELTFTIKYAILNIYISGKQFFNHSVI